MMHENTLRVCAGPGCTESFSPTNDDHIYHTAKCRAAASREKALAGPQGTITSGPRKNKRGVSITVQFTGEDAVRVLRMNPKDLVHVYPAATDAADDKQGASND